MKCKFLSHAGMGLLCLLLTGHAFAQNNGAMPDSAVAKKDAAGHGTITVAAFTAINTKGQLATNPFIAISIGRLYFENRYNYEANNSASINMGRTWGDASAVAITPMIGILAGNFRGINTEIQAYHDDPNWYVSTDNQYVMEYREFSRSFFYSWWVGRYKVNRFFRVGLTAQYTRPNTSGGVLDGGLTTSLLYKNITLNAYSFNFKEGRRSGFVSLRYTIGL